MHFAETKYAGKSPGQQSPHQLNFLKTRPVVYCIVQVFQELESIAWLIYSDILASINKKKQGSTIRFGNGADFYGCLQ